MISDEISEEAKVALANVRQVAALRRLERDGASSDGWHYQLRATMAAALEAFGQPSEEAPIAELSAMNAGM
jgi:hypothetical protein